MKGRGGYFKFLEYIIRFFVCCHLRHKSDVRAGWMSLAID